MPIYAENNPVEFVSMPAGSHLARCYGMVEIGTITEDSGLYKGKEHKVVRISWETPHECHDFGHGLQPFTIHKEFTQSMNEKANLRLMLESWRGAPFTDEQAKRFDITRLLGVACMINVIHKPKKMGAGMRAEIAAITPLPKGFECPVQVNSRFELSYDNWNSALFESLPDYVRNKMRISKEYIAMTEAPPAEAAPAEMIEDDDLPF